MISQELILIIEDDLTSLGILNQLVKSKNYIPITCPDGKVGIDMLDFYEFSVVLLDINLPDYDGWDIFESIINKTPRTSVLVLTSTETERTKSFHENYKDNPSYELSFKPYTKDLVDIIDRLIEVNFKKNPNEGKSVY